MIFGRAGSGKSTWALKLHHATGLPVYHLDKYFFESHWVERNYPEFLNMQQALVDQEKWIIDGNCIRSLEMRFAKADVVLYFRYPRLRCLVRLFRRLYDKNKRVDDRAPHCPERVTFRLVRYMWFFEGRVKATLQYLKRTYPETLFMEIRSERDLQKAEELLILRTMAQ